MKALAATGLFVAALLAAGCSESKPSRFYVLSSLSAPAAESARGGSAIGVGPVVIPQYLDRPEIVMRSSDNRLDLGEFDQWGGRIGDNITRVLAENLSGLLGTEKVSIYPWTNAAEIVHQVGVDITQFERDPSGTVTLAAFWTISDMRTGRLLVTRRSTIVKTLSQSAAGASSPYDEVVSAMSEALADLSGEIAAAIDSLPAS
jgi:uncharacterized lipoprotein YmbA